MDNDEEYVRVLGKLFVQQPDKVQSGIAIVDRQRTADSDYAGLFSGCRRDLARHRTLEGRNAFLAVPLFCQAERSIRG